MVKLKGTPLAKKLYSIGWWIALTFVLIWTLLPFYWLVTSSLKNRIDVFALPPKLLFIPTLENYIKVFHQYGVGQNFINSVIICLVCVTLSILVGVPAAYGFTRFSFRPKTALAFWILSLRMGPPIAVVLPFFLIWRSLRLLDTRIALIVTYISFNLPFVIWMMRGFFHDIPVEIEEAAMLDGCSRPRALFQFLLPMVLPGLAATAIFCFIFSWNEFLFAFTLSSHRAMTVPIIAANAVTSYGTEWGALTASGVLIMLPVIVFAILVRRQLLRGLTFGVGG